MTLPASIAKRLFQAIPFVCATVLVPAQAPVEKKTSEPEAQAAPSRTETDPEALIQELGSESFRDRTKAEKALKAIGKSALPALKKAAADHADPEVQWRARRLVRQLEQGTDGSLTPRDDGEVEGGADRQVPQGPRNPFVRRFSFGRPGVPQDVQQRFDELFQSLEQDFGVDIPRARFFDDSFFRDLEQQMQDMQKQLGGAQSSQGRSMSMQMGPDGVKVEIKTKNDQGAEETKTYEAPDLETFQRKYPGVLDGAGIGGGFSFAFPNGGLRTFGQTMPQVRVLGPRTLGQQLDPQDGFVEPQVDVAPPADRRLGVVVKPQVAPELLEHFGLDGALAVEEVQEGTLAHELGIEKGDLVTHVGGRAIADTQDVQQALGGIAAGADVEVKVLRKGKERTLVAKKPAAPVESASPLQRRKAAEQGETTGK